MSKYAALQHFLKNTPASQVPMTFAEIEKVIGAPLPASSRKHRAWWSNNPTNNVMTYAWLEAGFESADVDIASERLIFRRRLTNKTPPSATRVEAPATLGEGGAPICRHPAYGALKGMVIVPEDVDLTASWDSEWSGLDD